MIRFDAYSNTGLQDLKLSICRRFRVKDKTKEQAAIALIEKKRLVKR